MLISFKSLFKKYNIVPRGILHVGASEGQEAQRYDELGVKSVVWVEAIPEVYQRLVTNTLAYNHVCINECVGEVDGQEVEFNISSNEGQSSSYLEFGTHTLDHPDVKFIDKIKLKTKRLDTIRSQYQLDRIAYDFLVMDLQGCELMALKSMGKWVDEFTWIYLEVNNREVYKGCALVDEIDQFLGERGFIRVETKWTQAGWGDSLYLKNIQKF